MKNSRFLPPIASLLLVALGVAAFLTLLLLDSNFAVAITREDQGVENLSALLYLAGFLICLYRIVVARQRKEPLLYLWMFLCLLFLGEEVSWFQRVFNYSVPSVERVNMQNEFNLHNLEVLQEPWLGDGNPLNEIFMINSQGAFRLGYIFYFFVLPVLVALGLFKGLARRLGYRAPAAHFLAAIWVTIALSVLLLPWYGPLGLREPLAETREMFLALFVLVYVYTYLRYAPQAAAAQPQMRTTSTD